MALLPVEAQSDRFEEYEVKAAFLYNFAKFIHWPTAAFEEAESPIVFGVLGKENPFKGKLEQLLRGKTVNHRPLQFQHFQSLSELQDRPCHLLFVSGSEEKNSKYIFNQVAGRHTVTVSEFEGFTKQGGMIRFFVNQQGKIRFEINLPAVERERLKVSSKLLSLARLVEFSSNPEPNSAP